MNEHLEYRCCMCPQRDSDSQTCPAGHSCRFVKTYVDKRGWKFRVMSGIGENTYKARYQDNKHTGSSGWRGSGMAPWRESFDEAQSDLNKLAKSKGWEEA